MKTKLTGIVWLALGALVAVPATAWFIGSGAREARQLQFKSEGTDLKATDVDAALRELSQKLKQVESGQAALQGAAMVHQSQLGEVKAQVSEQRMTALESRITDVAAYRRRIEYTDGSDTSSVNARYAPLRDLGSFSKTSASSTLFITWNTHVDAMGEPGTFCDFQLRVDGKPDTDREGGGT
jgi:TolA-binding protein